MIFRKFPYEVFGKVVLNTYITKNYMFQKTSG